MQKAIIIYASSESSTLTLDPATLNRALADGWRLISAAPFGVATSHGGGSREKSVTAAILVVVEKPDAKIKTKKRAK